MRKYLLLCFLPLLIACSSSESDDIQPENTETILFNPSSLDLRIENITTNSMTVDLRINDPNFQNLDKRYFIKRPSDSEFTEITTNTLFNNLLLIENLSKGKRYEVIGSVIVEGETFNTPPTFFTTLGFVNNGGNVFTTVEALHERYTFTIGTANTNLLEAAQPLSAYVKVAADSIEVANLSIINENSIEFTVEDVQLQQFFENDTSYIPLKTFTLGFLSDEYYLEIQPNTSIIYDGIEATNYTLFNKTPQINQAVIVDVQDCIDQNNGRAGVINMRGSFWSYLNPLESNINKPNNFNIRLTNTDDSSIEKIYFPSDIVDNPFTNCTVEGIRPSREAMNGFIGFHRENIIAMRFNTDFIIPGNYEITYIAEKENQVYTSAPFPLTIE